MQDDQLHAVWQSPNKLTIRYPLIFLEGTFVLTTELNLTLPEKAHLKDVIKRSFPLLLVFHKQATNRTTLCESLFKHVVDNVRLRH